ncbi:hypothetical protein TTRE_0000377201 [Trichuris trichiura]|uniref:Uncharacterized protein n=1 Tax=Trichuris trichiura TaxID=36087 RepID=A0A077Z9W9_TRITR|nr:hypothetical protein TTRE_0000377201 [Trichuris trichiura]
MSYDPPPLASEHSCQLCPGRISFQSALEFIEHLRASHCKREGGSFICRYGPYSTCSALPVEGVSDEDYEEHVKKVHLAAAPAGLTLTLCSLQPSIVQDSTQCWSLCRSTQNLSAVLNDPRRDRSMACNFFIRHWGESFVDNAEIPPLYHVRNVSWKTFENYITRVAMVSGCLRRIFNFSILFFAFSHPILSYHNLCKVFAANYADVLKFKIIRRYCCIIVLRKCNP